MSATLRLPAPAKLNLMLHIVGRRDDGYHLLQSVFQFVDLCDWLEFTRREDDRIQRSGGLADLSADDDLAVRAARLLQARYAPDRGVDIDIEKQIPSGGGLGGGSSDAATTLLALNQLWQLGLSLDQLAEIGLELGADVPVFVRGRAAWAEGVGEVLEAVEIDEPAYLVVDPGVAVSTAQIFADEQLTRHCDPITIRAFLRDSGTNVCEAVVRKHHPEVAAALDWLGQFGRARMSGTGGCVFLALDSVQQADALKCRVPEPWSGYVARGLNLSPLHRQLGLPDE